jgi:hypothetical protein
VSRRDYAGCGLWALGFLVLVVVSFSVGVILRPDRGTPQVTLTSGGAGASAYVLVGTVDEADDPCVQLFPAEGGRDEGDELTGQCGLVGAEEGEAPRYRVTSAELADGTTVAFGPVARRAETVRLPLADGSTATARVRQAEGVDLRWFVLELDQPVDGPAEVLDAAGTVLTP